MGSRPLTGAERSRAWRARRKAEVLAREVVNITPTMHALLRDVGALHGDGYAAAIERGLRLLYHHHQIDLARNGVTQNRNGVALFGAEQSSKPNPRS